MIEFQETSKYNELLEIASNRNLEILDGIKQIAPSVHRIVKLRGRSPSGRDIDDILYDYNDFAEGNIYTRNEMVENLRAFSLVEATYYRLASNFAYNTAGIYGLNHRVDDLVDLAKDAVGGVVWKNWKPEKGEDFIDLHKKVVSILRHHLIHLWERGHRGYPFSSLENHALDRAKEVDLTEGKSPEEKPIHRFRRATITLPLPAIVARIDCDSSPIEKISALALIGYYPDGRGFTGVAAELGVKRDTLSSALDRVILRFCESEATFPTRPIKEIVGELLDGGVMKYSSGKNVEFNSPRLKLLKTKNFLGGLDSVESKILEMATARNGNTFTYSLGEIAQTCGCGFNKASRIMQRLADCPLDTSPSCA